MDPDAVEKIKSGSVDIENDLASDMVFKDAKKGDKAGEELIKEIFGTHDISHIA